MILSHWRWIWQSIVDTHSVPCSCLTYTRQEPTCPQLAGRYLWRHLDISYLVIRLDISSPTNPELWFWKFDFPTFVWLLQHVCWCWQTPNNRFVSLVKPRRGEAEKQRGSAGDVEICTTRVQLPYTIHSTPYIPEAWISSISVAGIYSPERHRDIGFTLLTCFHMWWICRFWSFKILWFWNKRVLRNFTTIWTTIWTISNHRSFAPYMIHGVDCWWNIYFFHTFIYSLYKMTLQNLLFSHFISLALNCKSFSDSLWHWNGLRSIL